MISSLPLSVSSIDPMSIIDQVYIGENDRSPSLFSSPEKSLNFPDIGVVLIVSNDRTTNDVEGRAGWNTVSGAVGKILPVIVGVKRVFIKPTEGRTCDAAMPTLQKDVGSREMRNTMGDKSKKDKEKGQKQNAEKQHQKDKKKEDKQPKRNV